MPDDLLDRVTAPDKYERNPSQIAAEHVARFAGIPENTCSYRDIRRYVKAGQELIEDNQARQRIGAEMSALSIQITSDLALKDK
jgi:hypothetical protein